MKVDCYILHLNQKGNGNIPDNELNEVLDKVGAMNHGVDANP